MSVKAQAVQILKARLAASLLVLAAQEALAVVMTKNPVKTD